MYKPKDSKEVSKIIKKRKERRLKEKKTNLVSEMTAEELREYERWVNNRIKK